MDFIRSASFIRGTPLALIFPENSGGISKWLKTGATIAQKLKVFFD